MKTPPLHLTLDQLASPGVIEFIQEASVWTVAPVAEDPELVLSRWQVMQLPNGHRHFVGRNVRDREGRTSTRIVEFDPSTRCGRTESGRVYQLLGPTGRDGDGQHVWHRWKTANGVTEFDDVSADVQAQIDKAAKNE